MKSRVSHFARLVLQGRLVLTCPVNQEFFLLILADSLDMLNDANKSLEIIMRVSL